MKPAPRPASSIRQRTLRVVLTTTLVALLLSAGALLLYELRTHRAQWSQDLQTQADLMALANLPALAVEDAQEARDKLALLRLRPQIEAAALYDGRHTLFAAYTAVGQVALPAQLLDAQPGHAFDDERLELRQAIVQQGRRMGTVVLRAHYDVLPRLRDYLLILGLVMLTSLALAALVARRLQHQITDPIVAVSDVAREVVQQRNFSLRAPRGTDDEVGSLVDSFNDMLAELGGQAAALQATDRRKDEFLATLAHELRNPLAPVATALTILARGDTDPATQARLLSMMQRQMQQFVRLIDDLMEVSRISTGRLALRTEPLDLLIVLRSAVEGVGPALLERGHRLSVDWPPPVWVDADRTRLVQVFANLLGNAAKYTDPGGRVELGFELLVDTVAVTVRDNGIGIAPEMQQEVFEMFVQVDHSHARGRSGLGVGLSLARQLVLLHGGSLELRSAGLGRGTAVVVRLSRLPAPPAPPVPPGEGVEQRGTRSLKVLLADDNRDFADSLAMVLEGLGHHVRVVYDGTAACESARHSLPDVGLFDIGMPGMDGYALAGKVRGQPGGAACLLVAITGWGQQADQQRAHAAGFDHHLVKPVDVPVLLRLLAEHAG